MYKEVENIKREQVTQIRVGFPKGVTGAGRVWSTAVLSENTQ